MTHQLAALSTGIVVPGAYRFPVEQYLRMIRDGIIPQAEQVELLDGIVMTKMGKNPPRILAVKRLVNLLSALLPAGWHVAKEDPVATPSSVPEPDVAILRGGPEDYADRLPSSRDVALIVEVADTSLVRDREDKRRIYAAAGVVEYWLADLAGRRLVRHRLPAAHESGADYTQIDTHRSGDSLPVVLDGQEIGAIRVAEILP